jgi:hypothetical protein
MHKYFFFVISLFLNSIAFSQKTNPPSIKVNKYSLFDNNIKTLMTRNLATFENKLRNNNHNLGYYFDYTGKYYELNNRYVCINNDIVDISNSSHKYYESKIVPQLLNDSLLLAFDGKIMNLNTSQFLSTTINKQNLNTKIINPNQIKWQSNVLKSDILMQEFNESGRRKFIYNLLSNGIFVHDQLNAFRGEILNNPQSKYFMFTERYLKNDYQNRFCLMNRYNVKDTLEVPSFSAVTTTSSNAEDRRYPVIYNDSTIYYALKVDHDYNFIKYKFNTNISVSFDDFAEYYGEFGERLKNTSISEANEIIATCYFHKKYNKVDVSNKIFDGFTNLHNIYENLLGYSPYVIIEYNFKDKKIKSIIDKPILPLTEISSMFIDNNNQYLIAQQTNKQFTIFNLRTKKEILTLDGIISGINNKNELILNVSAKRQALIVNGYALEPNNKTPPSYEITKLNLNELTKLSNEYFVTDFDSSLNVDEFTTKEVFNSKIKFKTNIVNPLFSKTEVADQKPKNTNSTLEVYSINYVSSFLDKLFNEYQNKVNAGSNKNDLIYKLNYLSYSANSKELEFKTDDLEDHVHDVLNLFPISEFRISDERYSGKKYSKILFENISIEDAKEYKQGSCYLIAKNTTSNIITIPDIANLFVFRHIATIERNFYFVNSPNSEESKKFYNSYVPINTKVSNYYNSLYLRFNNQEMLLKKNN